MKQEQGPKHDQIISCAILKCLFVPSLRVKRPKILRKRLSRQSCAENIAKVSEVKIKLKPRVKH